MKTNWWLGIVGALWLAGCTPSPEQVAPNEDIAALHDRFHGKYSIVSSVSDEAIDVNMDGKASTNMLAEITQLAPDYRCELVLHITGNTQVDGKPGFTMMQAWPEQYIWLQTKRGNWEWEPLDYDPKQTVNYAQQGASRLVSFAPDLTVINVDDDAHGDASVRWKKPVSVKVVGKHTIEVVNRKTLYTSEGTKTVLITTRYERYTMTT